MNKFITLILALVVAGCVSTPVEKTNLYDGIPTSQIGDLVSVAIICIGEEAALSRAEAAGRSEEEYVARRDKLIQDQKCGHVPQNMSYKIDRYIISVHAYDKTDLEVWQLEGAGDVKAYVLLKPAKKPANLELGI